MMEDGRRRNLNDSAMSPQGNFLVVDRVETDFPESVLRSVYVFKEDGWVRGMAQTHVMPDDARMFSPRREAERYERDYFRLLGVRPEDV